MSPAASPLQPWQTVFDALSEAVCIVDLEGRILNYNRALEILLGRPAGQILGRSCCRLLHGVDEPIPGCPFLRLKESRQRETLNLTTGDRTLRVTVEPLFNEAGTLIGAVHLLADISEQIRERADLLGRIRELEEQLGDRPPLEDPRINLYRRLTRDREAETRRHQRILSDGIGKLLAGLKLDLHAFQEITAPRLSPPLNACLDDIDRTWGLLQNLSEEIRPPLLDDLGLIPALRREINRLTEQGGAPITLQADLNPAGLSPEMETACFHLVRGALVLQSREAGTLTVSLRMAEGRLELVVGTDAPDFEAAGSPNRVKIEENPAWPELQERALLLGGAAFLKETSGRGPAILFQIPLADRS